jgi:hypothetical protein
MNTIDVLALAGSIASLVGLGISVWATPSGRRGVRRVWMLGVGYLCRLKRLIPGCKNRQSGYPLSYEHIERKAIAIRDNRENRHTRDFFVHDWDHSVTVDFNGNAITVVRCVLENTTDKPVQEVDFPLYGDSAAGPSDVWMSFDGDVRHPIRFKWNESTQGGGVKIRFPVPLQPRSRIVFSWGYQYQGVYGEGSEFWEWFIGRPQHRFKVKLAFHPYWAVASVRGSASEQSELSPAPRKRANTIHWLVTAPRPGVRYRLDFVLMRPSMSIPSTACA